MTDDRLFSVISKFPDAPGIYLFYNQTGELVYVGKATSLRDRVKSYFNGKRTFRPVEQLMHEVADIQYQSADSVLEAIVLEANAIKKYQPKYNVDGKDDKSWNYIVITKDVYPRVETIREHDLARLTPAEKKRFKYLLGPYPGLNAKATMKILRKLFLFSTCKPNQKRACLYAEIGQCLGVCTGIISAKEYRAKVIRPLVTFLKGKKRELVKNLERQMKTAVKIEAFEEAARLRNQISALQHIQDIALLNKSFVENESETRKNEFGSGRIEGYDISNLGPTGMVGSLVVFAHGAPEKSQYRKFKIRTVPGQSDVDCLEEMLRRRFNHPEWPFPQLLLIDGGKPQVNRAASVLRSLQLSIPLVGIAKGPDRKKNEIILGIEQPNFIKWVYLHTKLLIQVRDEAHRFAVKYQRTLRKLR